MISFTTPETSLSEEAIATGARANLRAGDYVTSKVTLRFASTLPCSSCRTSFLKVTI